MKNVPETLIASTMMGEQQADREVGQPQHLRAQAERTAAWRSSSSWLDHLYSGRMLDSWSTPSTRWPRNLGYNILLSSTAPGRDERQAAGELLAVRDRLPTAVFASNDRSAIGLLDTFRRAGLSTPDDISVAGYDDSLLAQLSHIDLTTVNQNAQRQGELAVRAAVAAVENPDAEPQDHAVEPKLIVRGTTGEPQR